MVKAQEDALRQFRSLGLRPSTLAAAFADRREVFSAFQLTGVREAQEAIRHSVAPIATATTFAAAFAEQRDQALKAFQRTGVREMQEALQHAIAPTVATSTMLADLAKQHDQTLKTFQLTGVREAQEAIRHAIAPIATTTTMLADFAQQREAFTALQTRPFLELQKAARNAIAPWSDTMQSLVTQVLQLARSPIHDSLNFEFARLRAEVALATGPLPQPARVESLGDAIEVGIVEAGTLQERWAALPMSKRLTLDVCLMSLCVAVGEVVDDFAPSEHLSRVLNLLAVLAALHAFATWWEDAFGDND